MATVEVEVQNEDNSGSDKKTIFRYRRLYDMFLFISILLLFIKYFEVQCELEELRKLSMIPTNKEETGPDGPHREVVQPFPILGSDGCKFEFRFWQGKCYRFEEVNRFDWDQAYRHCRNKGAVLTSYRNLEGKWNDASHIQKLNGLVCSYKP